MARTPAHGDIPGSSFLYVRLSAQRRRSLRDGTSLHDARPPPRIFCSENLNSTRPQCLVRGRLNDLLITEYRYSRQPSELSKASIHFSIACRRGQLNMTPHYLQIPYSMLSFGRSTGVPFTHTSSVSNNLGAKKRPTYGASSTYFAAAFHKITPRNLAWLRFIVLFRRTHHDQSVTDTSTNSYTISLPVSTT